MKNDENLFAKNVFETSLEIIGKCFIASLRTFTLESSPSDNISSPINCSQSCLPKQSLIVLNNCTATIRLS